MKRRLYFAAGMLCVGLGAVGAALPLLPTVPFLLLALFCFARSNPVWEQKLLDHPKWGPQLLDWRERGAISRKSKVIAVLTVLASGVLTWFMVGHPYAWLSTGVLVIVAGWIATRPE